MPTEKLKPGLWQPCLATAVPGIGTLAGWHQRLGPLCSGVGGRWLLIAGQLGGGVQCLSLDGLG